MIPSAKVNNDESATVELCWRRPSGLTVELYRGKHVNQFYSNRSTIIKRTCILQLTAILKMSHIIDR